MEPPNLGKKRIFKRELELIRQTNQELHSLTIDSFQENLKPQGVWKNKSKYSRKKEPQKKENKKLKRAMKLPLSQQKWTLNKNKLQLIG